MASRVEVYAKDNAISQINESAYLQWGLNYTVDSDNITSGRINYVR